ncbi:aminopeptidase N-like [Penaeus indicus]|uniref:aminopeptidase N-like n=1 Tax=Penaeus indicus TaxID=29960 RepID=UPI00300D7DD2
MKVTSGTVDLPKSLSLIDHTALMPQLELCAPYLAQTTPHILLRQTGCKSPLQKTGENYCQKNSPKTSSHPKTSGSASRLPPIKIKQLREKDGNTTLCESYIQILCQPYSIRLRQTQDPSRDEPPAMELTKTKAVAGGAVVVVLIVAAGLVGHFATPQTTCQEFQPPSTTTDTPTTTQAPPTLENYLLPTSLQPIHYDVKLQPFVNGNFSIMGHVEIEMVVREGTSNITLHMADITVRENTIMLKNKADLSAIQTAGHEYDAPREFFVVRLAEELPAGAEVVLSMGFEGFLNDELRGFYRSTYTNGNGDQIMLAATQFQPTDARRAFPCLDEPALKATFAVSLAREERMSTLSNMMIKATEPVEGQAGWVWDHYDTTVKMSTYLVAFVVSDFEFLSAMAGQTNFSVWARPEAMDQAGYSLDVGVDCLTYFESYFNIPYPLPKQDMVALPDFAAGAMENWGLILYRETAMLYSSAASSASNKQRVAVVVVHELAHQWFGNLVTPTWWTDLWLNEGFASFMEFIGVDHVEPTWRMMDQFVVDTLHYVFGIDSLESSHPISIPVGHPDEINEIFDSISYYKGASIIRMMYFFLTEATFKKGLTTYLNHFAYDAAAQDDLWQFLTEAAHEDDTLAADVSVKDIMDTWTLQTGYPVVRVERDAAGTSATVTQERFLLLPSASGRSDASWWVPLTVTSQDAPDFSQTRPSAWLPAGAPSTSLSGLPSADAWILLNLQQTGYFRVNYDAKNWELLTKQLADAHEVIHVTNRAQVMDDALNLARAGQLPYDTALGLTSYLAQEKEYTPWEAAMSSLSYIEKMFTRTAGYGPLRAYLLDLITPLYDDVGFEDDLSGLHLDQYKRVLALSWACHLGHPQCVAESLQLYNNPFTPPPANSAVSPNLKSTVYCTAIAGGGEAEWEAAWALYLEANVGAEKDRLLSAMGCTKEIWLLSRYLDMAFTDGSAIRRQDARTVFRAVANNDVGRYIAWDFLRNNWEAISSYMGAFTSLGDLISYVTAEFNTNEELQQLESFYEANLDNLGTATRAFEQAIESTRNNIGWMSSNYEAIVSWLDGVAETMWRECKVNVKAVKILTGYEETNITDTVANEDFPRTRSNIARELSSVTFQKTEGEYAEFSALPD